MKPYQDEAVKARELTIAPCRLTEVSYFVETHHYSHNLNGVKVQQCFSVKAGARLVGAAVFGALSTTAWRRFASSEEKVLELRRLVLLDCAGRNSESRVIGWALRWLRRNLPQLEVVVSYADPAYGHDGTIYRASNFTYLGISAPDKAFRDERGKLHHSRSLRTRYRGEFKPFVKRLRAQREAGLLEQIDLPGKHVFLFRLRATGTGRMAQAVLPLEQL